MHLYQYVRGRRLVRYTPPCDRVRRNTVRGRRFNEYQVLVTSLYTWYPWYVVLQYCSSTCCALTSSRTSTRSYYTFVVMLQVLSVVVVRRVRGYVSRSRVSTTYCCCTTTVLCKKTSKKVQVLVLVRKSEGGTGGTADQVLTAD